MYEKDREMFLEEEGDELEDFEGEDYEVIDAYYVYSQTL